MGFTVGQRVTTFDGSADELRGMAIVLVDKVTHGGKRVHVGASVYNEHGRHKEGPSLRGARIAPTTPEHEQAIARRDLWRAIDRAIGPPWARLDEQEKLRAAISTDVLRQIAALLEVTPPALPTP